MRNRSILYIVIGLLLTGVNHSASSQELSWNLSVDGQGISNHQELSTFNFIAGSGLTSFTYSSTGVYAKSWSSSGLDTSDYFQVGFRSTALDTFLLKSIAYSERRSSTGIRTYELQYASHADFSDASIIGTVQVPDDDLERDTILLNLDIFVLPQDSFYLRWYGYNAESSAGSWRINDGSLDMQLETYVEDTQAPSLIAASALDSRTIEMHFNERIDSNSLVLNNFNVDDLFSPISIEKQYFSQGKLTLHFDQDLPNEVAFNFNYKGISDFSGNSAENFETINLFYYQAKALYVVFNEVMADPTPQIYLPEVEYIELYNEKTFPIQLENWKLKINSYEYTFPNIEIGANAYLTIIPLGTDSLFADSIQKLELFDDGKLTNSSALLAMYSNDGTWVHQLEYTEDWHTSSYKKEGGWSLEQKDPQNACTYLGNWQSSVSEFGGTPGYVNSQLGTVESEVSIEIDNIYFLDSASVFIRFDAILDPLFVADFSKYTIDGSHPMNVNYTAGKNYIELFIDRAFDSNQTYYLTIDDNIYACSGAIFLVPYEIRIGIPTSVAAGDLSINEILFDPITGHEKYIEIFNLSDKIIDAQELKIGVYDQGEWTPKDVLSKEPRLIFTGDYIVFTKDRADVLNQYHVKNPMNLIQTEELPSFSTTESTVAIANKGDLIIDKIYYNSDFHSPFLAITDGVALERINAQINGLNASAWQSASETAGYGTPTYQNSQYKNQEDNTSNSVIFFESESFSPDLDGFDDYLLINYKLDVAGYKANLTIYDPKGNKIVNLVQNELVGTTGQWTWDGRDFNDQPVSVGIYLVIASFIGPDGQQFNDKKVCVLSAKQ
ncbi:MAG: lamin tail domain-containing protein [Bacteroidales bacterium]|nr:lamin tail domain-containing protein [Bacteroidales bacterium]